MKTFLVMLLLLPATALAQTPASYAKRWPLVLSGEQAGAYRVVLDREVYATTAWPDLLAGQHQRPTLGVGRGRLRQRGGRQQQQHHQERLHAAASSCPDRRGGAGAR